MVRDGIWVLGDLSRPERIPTIFRLRGPAHVFFGKKGVRRRKPGHSAQDDRRSAGCDVVLVTAKGLRR